jgi:copper chaperone CopZ
MNAVTLKIEDMHCDGCAAKIQTALERSTGVRKASVSFDDGEARVLYDPEAVAESQLIATIENIGYRVARRRNS